MLVSPHVCCDYLDMRNPISLIKGDRHDIKGKSKMGGNLKLKYGQY